MQRLLWSSWWISCCLAMFIAQNKSKNSITVTSWPFPLSHKSIHHIVSESLFNKVYVIFIISVMYSFLQIPKQFLRDLGWYASLIEQYRKYKSCHKFWVVPLKPCEQYKLQTTKQWLKQFLQFLFTWKKNNTISLRFKTNFWDNHFLQTRQK